jgi:hypothetical protein
VKLNVRNDARTCWVAMEKGRKEAGCMQISLGIVEREREWKNCASKSNQATTHLPQF